MKSAGADVTLTGTRILLVGNAGGTNVGASLGEAAKSLGLPVRLVDATRAMDGPGWLRRFKWHFRDHTPTRLAAFSREVVDLCNEWKPNLLLTTGAAPLTYDALAGIRALGIRCCNFSTDDPWNPSHRSHWFVKALSAYDVIFTPRRGNLDDMRRVTRAAVLHLPFGYDPGLFFPVELTPGEREELASDVMFAGGADGDRVPYISALQRAGMRVALYGTYWDRFAETRSLTQRQADVVRLRKATAAARVSLCLVRRANRDGHSMRTFELPAMKACVVMERTTDHVDLFGAEGTAALYFETVSEMVEKVRWLLDHPDRRWQMAQEAHRLIVEGRHTYPDRLRSMLEAAPCARS